MADPGNDQSVQRCAEKLFPPQCCFFGRLAACGRQTGTAGYTLEAVLSLPQKYRNVIYLHYYEGYAATEIADIMHKPVNTVYTMLARARKLLKEKLGGDEVE